MSMTAGLELTVELRHRRRALRAEYARVVHWRRLVRARLDLAVAAVATPAPLGESTALGLVPKTHPEIPRTAELRRAVRGPLAVAEVQELPVLRDLDDRLARYQRWVDDALREATDLFIEHLSREPAVSLADLHPPGCG